MEGGVLVAKRISCIIRFLDMGFNVAHDLH